jgi:nitrite reductase/ring-hydroxylating ferredoxin subunit
VDRALELQLTDEALQYMENRLGDYSETVFELPVDVYTSAERQRREVEQLFRRSALVAGMSCELARPGDHKSIDLAGVPVIVSRDADGAARAFLNVCRHRGAKVVEDSHATSKRFVCPYHGWVYDGAGRLCNLAGADEAFEGMDSQKRGLVPLPVTERHGLIWVVPDADAGPIDLDELLGPLGPDLAGWRLDECVHVDTRTHRVDANWKLVVETFTENYHLRTLHKKTLAPIMTYFANLQEPLGDHQRMVFPGYSLDKCKDIPREQWTAFDDWGLTVVYNIFPNTIMVLLCDHYEIFQMFPGRTPETSYAIQNVYAHNQAQMREKPDALAEQANLIEHVLTTEDLHAVSSIQAGIRSRGNETFVFGRNEIAAHHFHQRVLDRLGPDL